MPYSQFTLESIQLDFSITIEERVGIFAEVPEVTYSDFLAETLKYNTPLALAIATAFEPNLNAIVFSLRGVGGHFPV